MFKVRAMETDDGALPDYLPYSDEVEVMQADEAALIAQVVASMQRISAMVFDRRRHAVRNAHAKSHGILRGTLSIPADLPAHLRQGLFARPASYPVVLRYSSAPGDILKDAVPAPKGLAIKVIGVSGRKVMVGHEDAMTQDFLLANHPVIPFGTIGAYWKVEQLREAHANDDEVLIKAGSAIARNAAKALEVAGIDSALLPSHSVSNRHILGETFHSMAALRFGRYIAKISVAPLSSSVRALAGKTYDPTSSPSVLRDQVVDFFRNQGAEFEVRAQLCTDLKNMPVEDASVPWSESLSPQQPIARIIVAPQDAFSAQRRVYADEVLSFNPWHCLPEHRPLGSIMRVRLASYAASSAFRHAMNQQPSVEPRSRADLPF
jgi:hypothetical protein